MKEKLCEFRQLPSAPTKIPLKSIKEEQGAQYLNLKKNLNCLIKRSKAFDFLTNKSPQTTSFNFFFRLGKNPRVSNCEEKFNFLIIIYLVLSCTIPTCLVQQTTKTSCRECQKLSAKKAKIAKNKLFCKAFEMKKTLRLMKAESKVFYAMLF